MRINEVNARIATLIATWMASAIEVKEAEVGLAGWDINQKVFASRKHHHRTMILYLKQCRNHTDLTDLTCLSGLVAEGALIPHSAPAQTKNSKN